MSDSSTMQDSRRNRYKGVRVSEAQAERFWRKVDVQGRGACWPWTGYCKPARLGGHGFTTCKELGKSPMYAHRIAWLLKRGAVADGLCVLHKCHNPACCNPEHLYLGTRAENMADRFDKTRKYRVRKVRPCAVHTA